MTWRYVCYVEERLIGLKSLSTISQYSRNRAVIPRSEFIVHAVLSLVCDSPRLLAHWKCLWRQDRYKRRQSSYVSGASPIESHSSISMFVILPICAQITTTSFGERVSQLSLEAIGCHSFDWSAQSKNEET